MLLIAKLEGRGLHPLGDLSRIAPSKEMPCRLQLENNLTGYRSSQNFLQWQFLRTKHLTLHYTGLFFRADTVLVLFANIAPVLLEFLMDFFKIGLRLLWLQRLPAPLLWFLDFRL